MSISICFQIFCALFFYPITLVINTGMYQSYLITLFSQTQKDVTQVIANLQRQKVDSRLVASEYLEANSDLLDILMSR